VVVADRAGWVWNCKANNVARKNCDKFMALKKALFKIFVGFDFKK
jgi:hypothetical protein